MPPASDRHLKPWRVESFKVSNDPRCEEKLVDVVGLYLNPPGRAGTMTHDYKRNGTIDLFEAMNHRHRRGTHRPEQGPHRG